MPTMQPNETAATREHEKTISDSDSSSDTLDDSMTEHDVFHE
jgi:hypothetical protein